MPISPVASRSNPGLASGLLETWLVDLEALTAALLAIEVTAKFVSADEKTRAGGMTGLNRADRWIAARVALRVLLERRGGACCRGQSFVHAPGGKPALANSGLAFSVSDTGRFLLVGLYSHGRIGVDIEAPRRLNTPPHRIALWIAAGAGLSGGAATDHCEIGTAAALAAWTRIEAFAKARGPTLASSLSDLGMIGTGNRVRSPDKARVRAQTVINATGLAVYDLAMPTGLYGSIALEADGASTAPAVRVLDHAALVRLINA